MKLVSIHDEENELARKAPVDEALAALTADLRARIEAGEREFSLALSVEVRDDDD